MLTEHFRQVNGYPADKLEEALTGAEVIVIPAGVPRKVSLRLWLILGRLLTTFVAWSEYYVSFSFRFFSSRREIITYDLEYTARK